LNGCWPLFQTYSAVGYGIRMALGADTGSAVWMVMREVLLLAAIGVAVGMGAAWDSRRLVA
jgi:hypothetical protein